jgi:Kef-type K+ transport system membrane component KefB
MTPFLQLILSLIIIITGAKAGGWLANRLRQPAVLGELLTGLLLGPSVLDLMGWSILTNTHEPELLSETILQFAELGLVSFEYLHS